MKTHIHMVIGTVTALMLPAYAAQANQMDVFEQACGTSHDSFAAHAQLVTDQGWRRNDTDPALGKLMAGINRNTMIEHVRGYTHQQHRQPYVLTLSRGSGLTICTVLAPGARTAIDEGVFDARFNPLRLDANRLLNNISEVFYADADAPPVPRYKIIGDRRPKVELGLVGQRITASYFTKLVGE